MKTNAAVVDQELHIIMFKVEDSLAEGIEHYRASDKKFLDNVIDVVSALMDEGEVLLVHSKNAIDT